VQPFDPYATKGCTVPKPSKSLSIKKKQMNRRKFLTNSAAVAAGAATFGQLSTLSQTRSSASAGASAEGQPQLSACIEALFTKTPFEQRIEHAKAAGLRAFEFWGWRNKNLEALAAKKQETGLELAAFSCDTGGALVAPGSAEKFLPTLRDSIAAAKRLNCSRLIATVGNERKDLSRAEQHDNIVAAFKAGAPICEDAGVTLVIEPLNVLVNHKGYYLATSEEGFQIVDKVGSPNVLLLFDIYHQQITEGNLIQNITRNIKKIGHFHVADVPGRHHLGTGEINYENVFRAIAKAGYTAFIGLEMWPTIDHTAATKQASALLSQALS
jgi:hydroxypyruvate isomerase